MFYITLCIIFLNPPAKGVQLDLLGDAKGCLNKDNGKKVTYIDLEGVGFGSP
jgi:hypothetical protein